MTSASAAQDISIAVGFFAVSAFLSHFFLFSICCRCCCTLVAFSKSQKTRQMNFHSLPLIGSGVRQITIVSDDVMHLELTVCQIICNAAINYGATIVAALLFYFPMFLCSTIVIEKSPNFPNRNEQSSKALRQYLPVVLCLPHLFLFSCS
jgi:hypothetical protein